MDGRATILLESLVVLTIVLVAYGVLQMAMRKWGAGGPEALQRGGLALIAAVLTAWVRMRLARAAAPPRAPAAPAQPPASRVAEDLLATQAADAADDVHEAANRRDGSMAAQEDEAMRTRLDVP